MAEKAAGYDISLPERQITQGTVATAAARRATVRDVLADHGRAGTVADA